MKRLLLRQVHIVDPNSPYHDTTCDILIVGPQIERIDHHIHTSADLTVQEDGLCVSPGWMDIGAQVGEPGYEHRETIQSFAAAAVAGGFTAVAPFGDTDPVIDDINGIQYWKNAFASTPLEVYPLAALSQNMQGERLTEFYELYDAGAVGFSDALHPIEDDRLLLLALQYAKDLNAVVFDFPCRLDLLPGGMAHEGAINIRLGLTGIPVQAESIRVRRDIELCKYTQGKCMLYGISSQQSVEAIAQAREEHLPITAAVPIWNVVYTDETLLELDPMWKLLPPLRSEAHKISLLEAVRRGIIDVVVSNHTPLEIEAKQRPFPSASYGAVSVQTCFSLLYECVQNHWTLDEIVRLMSLRPREVLGIDPPSLREGTKADLTLFNPIKSWQFDHSINASLSRNSPLLGRTMRGKVLGVVNKGMFALAHQEPIRL